ncbi:spore coat protein [Bacillus sp. CGMCC 1.16607]|uniref:spore coat protein n=1 Tax=Bacillus sp. CGMCC 1.16607 TaxID=3351842 RepID=UPI0036269AF2
MENLKKVIDSTLRVHPRGTMADMLLSHTLKRYGIQDTVLKNLSPEQKQRVNQIVSNIQAELGKVLDQGGEK